MAGRVRRRSRDPRRIGVGRPASSTATSTTSASVTFTLSPWPPPHRSASTETRTVIDVRPTRTVSVKKLTMSPRKTGSWNSTSRIAFVTQRRRRGLARLDRRGEVDVGEDHAAEDRAQGVRVLGQQQHLDRGDALHGSG